MYEQLTRKQTYDLIRGHAAIGTANPQVAWELLLGELRKEVRILIANPLRPNLVALEEMFQGPHLRRYPPGLVTQAEVPYGLKVRIRITL